MSSDKKSHLLAQAGAAMIPRELGLIPRGDGWVYVVWDWGFSELCEILKTFDESGLKLKLSSNKNSPTTVIDVADQASGWLVPLPNEFISLEVEFGFFINSKNKNWCCLSKGIWPGNAQSSTSNRQKAYEGFQKYDFPFNHSEVWHNQASNDLSIGSGSQISYSEPLSSPMSLSSKQYEIKSEEVIEKKYTDDGVPSNSETSGITNSERPNEGQKLDKSILVTEFSLYGKVDHGVQIFWNGKRVDVNNGSYSLRIKSPENSKTITGHLSIVSADGKHREVREIKLFSSVSSQVDQ